MEHLYTQPSTMLYTSCYGESFPFQRNKDKEDDNSCSVYKLLIEFFERLECTYISEKISEKLINEGNYR